MDRQANLLALAIVAGLAAPVLAQDSISKNSDAGSGMPGDALNWVDPLAQRTRYSVDSQVIKTSWGMKFGIVPLVKTDRPVNPALGQGTVFFNNLAGSFGMSRTERAVPFRGSSYAFWQAATAGINPTENDQSLNNSPLSPTGSSFQFTAFVNQFGTASTPANQTTVNSAIGAVVNFAPDNIRRFYVERSLLAVSNPTGGPTSNNGSTAEGSSDSNGQFYLRADNNGGNSAAASRVQGQNIYRVNLLSRSSTLNVLSGSGATTVASDAAATQFVANNYTTNTMTIPSVLPASLGLGGNGRYMGPDFARNYVYENTPGAITVEGPGSANSYLSVIAPNVSPFPDHRGAICVYPGSLFGAGTVATAAILARDGLPTTSNINNDRIALWGVNSDGSVSATKKFSIAVPASVNLDRAPASDNSPIGPTIFQTTGAIPATMSGYFGGHQGATAFQGGNSQLAIGQDLAGRGLIAGLYYESFSIGGNDLTPTPNNAIVVGRFDPANPGAIVWQTVAWTYAAGPNVADCDGSPLTGDWGNNGNAQAGGASPGQFDGTVDLNSGSGTYDRPIGRLQPTLTFTTNPPTVLGSPAFSMPAIDSVGNIWFTVRVAAINTYSSTTQTTYSRYDSALIRAIYNPDTFTYNLELVAEFGDRFLGKNSLTKYSLGGFVFAASNNAPSPSTFFSSSVAPFADRNMNVAAALTAGDMTTWGSNGAVVDPRTLGGLVLGGNILYDVNGDNSYQDPSGTSPTNPLSPDESYSALMYINFRSCDCDLNGDTLVDDSDFVIFAAAYNNLLDTFGDFNFDNLTDDSDFVIFAQAYDQLLCTLQPN